jgi:hypothetical protein
MQLHDVRIPADAGGLVLDEKDIGSLAKEGIADELMKGGAHAGFGFVKSLKEMVR